MGNRIAELASRIHAATYELLVLIRDFDAAGAWSGFTSCAAWLSWRTGLEPGPAREHVRVAHALAQLPKLSEAMRRGRVSYSKVRAVTRVATPQTEQSLLDVALAGTAVHVERVVRAWRQADRAAEGIEDRVRQAGRSLHAWVDDDGMVVVRGRLTPEVGSVFRRALEAAVAADAGAAAGATGGGAAGTADGGGTDAVGRGSSASTRQEVAEASYDSRVNTSRCQSRRRREPVTGTAATPRCAGAPSRRARSRRARRATPSRVSPARQGLPPPPPSRCCRAPRPRCGGVR